MTGRPDPLQLPETAGRIPSKRRRSPKLSLAEQLVAGAVLFLGIYSVGLFVAGMDDAWVYLIGVGVGLVLHKALEWGSSARG